MERPCPWVSPEAMQSDQAEEWRRRSAHSINGCMYSSLSPSGCCCTAYVEGRGGKNACAGITRASWLRRRGSCASRQHGSTGRAGPHQFVRHVIDHVAHGPHHRAPCSCLTPRGLPATWAQLLPLGARLPQTACPGAQSAGAESPGCCQDLTAESILHLPLGF